MNRARETYRERAVRLAQEIGASVERMNADKDFDAFHVRQEALWRRVRRSKMDAAVLSHMRHLAFGEGA